MKSKQHHLFDTIIAKTHYIKSNVIKKAADLKENCWTDHRHEFCNTNVKLKINKR